MKTILKFLSKVVVMLLILITMPIAIIGGVLVVKGITSFLLWILIISAYLRFLVFLLDKVL